jgi:hypothetical protein
VTLTYPFSHLSTPDHLPLLAFECERVLLVLGLPPLQFLLHGVKVLLHVVHDLAEGVRAPGQRLDGSLQLLNLALNLLPLFSTLGVA